MKKWLKELALILLALFILSNALSLYRSKDLSDTKITLDGLITINNTIYTPLKQKPLLVYFWGSWCPVCKLTSPNVNFLAKHINVLTVAINSGDDEDIKSYISKHDLDFEVINDNSNKIASFVKVFPTVMIFDKDGNLVSSDVGYSSTLMLFLKYLYASL